MPKESWCTAGRSARPRLLVCLYPPSGLRSAVSREEHRMDWPGTVPAAMRPVRVCNALRTTCARKATAKEVMGPAGNPRCRVRLERLESVEYGHLWRYVPVLGPGATPNGEGGPVGCLALRASTTASVTVATADFPPRVRAAEPKRPISTCFIAVGAPPRRTSSFGHWMGSSSSP
jgi:hypothetical protein